jgi:hypothetical protein
MDSYEKAERKRQARHRLHAQKARAGRLRNRVIAISLVCFALLWGAVFVQMATGNDPVLGRAATNAASVAQEGAGPEEDRQRRGSRQNTTPSGTSAAGSPPLEAEGAESEATAEAELEAEITQAEAESAEAEAIEFEAAEEELEPVTSSQS